MARPSETTRLRVGGALIALLSLVWVTVWGLV